MNKQMKVVSTLSAAALLAVGFSAVSLASGWDNSTGNWQYLDSDGEAVTDTWKSVNGQWFYLGDDGNMVVNALIEDTSGSKTKYYYVDENGAMVKNTWKAVAMDGSEDLEAEYWWYYFGSDGRAYNCGEGGMKKSNLKTINGLKYAFDQDGHMFYGWVQTAQTENDEDEDHWKDAEWYFNGWNDGHAATGWQQITVEDNENSDSTTQTYWFNFDSNGKKRSGTSKKINNKWYRFDDDGHMITEWSQNSSTAIDEDNTYSGTGENVTFLKEDGSEIRNGWAYAIPAEDWLANDYDNNDYSWFYFNASGKKVANQIKKINGKYYAFDNYGRMMTGFVVDDGTNVGRPSKLYGTDAAVYTGDTKDSAFKHDTLEYDEFLANDFVPSGAKLYYFNTDEATDGRRVSGYMNIALADDTYQFYFNTKAPYTATTGYVSKIKKFTVNGLVLKATEDTANYVGVLATYDTTNGYTLKANTVLDYEDIVNKGAGNVVLINKSGAVVKGTNKVVKDSDEHYYIVDSYGRVQVTIPDKDTYDSLKDATATSTAAKMVTEKVWG